MTIAGILCFTLMYFSGPAEVWWIDWLMDWSIDRLIDWLINCSIDWLIDCSIDWLIDWLIDWVIDWLIWFHLSFYFPGNLFLSHMKLLKDDSTSSPRTAGCQCLHSVSCDHAKSFQLLPEPTLSQLLCPDTVAYCQASLVARRTNITTFCGQLADKAALYCPRDGLPVLLCTEHIKLHTGHGVCPCGDWTLDNVNRCRSGHVFHADCFTECPHDFCASRFHWMDASSTIPLEMLTHILLPGTVKPYCIPIAVLPSLLASPLKNFLPLQKCAIFSLQTWLCLVVCLCFSSKVC